MDSDYNASVIAEYKSIRSRNFIDVAVFHCTRILWVLEKIDSGELVKGSDVYTHICDLPGEY